MSLIIGSGNVMNNSVTTSLASPMHPVHLTGGTERHSIGAELYQESCSPTIDLFTFFSIRRSPFVFWEMFTTKIKPHLFLSKQVYEAYVPISGRVPLIDSVQCCDPKADFIGIGQPSGARLLLSTYFIEFLQCSPRFIYLKITDSYYRSAEFLKSKETLSCGKKLPHVCPNLLQLKWVSTLVFPLLWLRFYWGQTKLIFNSFFTKILLTINRRNCPGSR